MEAQVPSQKLDFTRIVLGCKGLSKQVVKNLHVMNQVDKKCYQLSNFCAEGSFTQV
jgi:hypothetical protein